ncbi:deoxyribonuclease IV [Planobispora longispora]|uniref:Deoxyribonuclease IV n=1 Tax=Planobispora longispora TaxID=28887 RepID=A0A8J3RGN4_9ACTN|nr:deoxyribonuclease IV [Planobispora longispora]
MQFFLGDPQGWKGPVIGEKTREIAGSDVDVYVHAPYVINVATANNRIRIPSRKLLSAHLAAAAELGARGLIVHGGHVGAGDDPQKGFDNWRKVFERLEEHEVPVLIENTAGGGNAMARKLERIARLWDALDGFDVGFCLDTCHAHAGGEELADVVERVMAITGRIDLVHCNDSRDAFDSGADRHANLGAGQIDTALILDVCRKADAPIVVETPSGGQAEDIAFLRKSL